MLMLGMLAAPAMAATPDSEVQVTKIVVEPSGPDMNFTVYYETSFFTRVLSIIFGAKVLQPSIEHVFDNFTNVSLVSIDSNNGVAKVTANNVSVLNGSGWYVYDRNTTFRSKVGVIEVHNPDGKVVTVNDTDTLPVISNRVPMLNKN